MTTKNEPTEIEIRYVAKRTDLPRDACVRMIQTGDARGFCGVCAGEIGDHWRDCPRHPDNASASAPAREHTDRDIVARFLS